MPALCNIYKWGEILERVMLRLFYEKSALLATIIERWGYVAARKEVGRSAQENYLSVADVPLLIQAMSHHPEVRKTIRPQWVDTLTSECLGLRNGQTSYEAWHSVGSLATVEGLENSFSKKGAYGFMPISEDEWGAVGTGDGRARVSLDDVKRGDVPAGMPYSIFAYADTLSVDERPLTHERFLRDDRVLMISGSLENRELLTRMLFSEKEEGGEGWHAVENMYHVPACFDNPRGRLLCLGDNNTGFFGSELARVGRFAAVRQDAGGEGGGEPTIDEIIAVFNNPDLNREGMAKAVTQLFQR